jgi:uncharacterized membrane protein
MATITVLKFETATGAGGALAKLQDLQKQSLITIQDAAIVTWPAGAKKPKTQQLANMTGKGALDGAFWGMLFGLIFFVPFFGLAIGAAIGALAGHFNDYGIDDKFIKDVQSKVTEGTSALFLMSSNAVMDKVMDAFKGEKIELLSTNLSKEQEAKLTEAFAAEAQG